MTSCRRISALAVLLAGFAATAFAQATQPAPAAAPSPGAADTTIQNLPLPAAPPGGGTEAAGTSGVEVGTLGDQTPDYAGTLEEGSGGFPLDMWKGTDRALVERLLPQLPAATASPAMRDLERRLLLTNAEAPAGKRNAVNLFTARADRLAAMGLSRDAAALLAMMPEKQADSVAARLRLDSLLLAGDLDGTCKAVDDTRPVASADSYWQETQVFCQYRAGQAEQASLGVDLLSEQGHKDGAFFKLADALGGDKVVLNSLRDSTPLDLAMLHAAKLPLPGDAAQSRNPGVLAALAQDPSLDPKLRLAAAEEAAATYAISIAELQDAYTGITFEAGGLDKPLADSAKDPGAIGRARLYQATGATPDAQGRARLVQAALDRARHQGGYLLAVQVNLIYLLPLLPMPDLAWFAGDAGRALYVAGHFEQANAWLELAQSRAASDAQSAAAASALGGYARIAGVGPPLKWPGEASDGSDRTTFFFVSDRAQRLFAIFDGLGEPLGGGGSMIGQSAGHGPEADPALLFNLSEAAAAHRIGETVLLSLYALGPEGPAGCNPLSLARVIAALRQVGLDGEARAIAVEAAIAAGV